MQYFVKFYSKLYIFNDDKIDLIWKKKNFYCSVIEQYHFKHILYVKCIFYDSGISQVCGLSKTLIKNFKNMGLSQSNNVAIYLYMFMCVFVYLYVYFKISFFYQNVLYSIITLYFLKQASVWSIFILASFIGCFSMFGSINSKLSHLKIPSFSNTVIFYFYLKCNLYFIKIKQNP